MELLKQQWTPVGTAASIPFHRQKRGHSVGLTQQALETAVVALLIRPAGGTAAMQLQVQLIPPDRQLVAQGLQLLEERTQGALVSGQRRGLPVPELHLLQHFLRWPTAVIANPWDPQGFVDAGAGLPLALFLEHVQWISAPTDRRQHQAEQLGAAPASPTKQTMGEGIGGIPGQLVGAEPVHTGLLGHRRQPGSEAEAVRQPGEVMTPFRKHAAAVGLSQCELLPKRSRAHQNAIRLHPGAIDRLPTPRLAGAADLFKQIGPMSFDPGVERWRGMGKVKLWPAFHQLQRRAEGPLRGLPGVRHRPQPGQIEMGMAEPMHPSTNQRG